MPDGENLDTHYEAILDDEPDPTRPPVYVDVVARTHERRPILPAALHRGNLAASVRRTAGLNLHRLGYHAARLPLYLLLACMYAGRGAVRVTGRQLAWWWVLEQHTLRQGAAAAGDAVEWRALHDHARATRRWRGIVLVAELVALLVGYALLRAYGRWPAYVAVAVLLVPLLAHYGRPVDRPIVTPAVVTARYRRITADIVLRALYAAGLGRPDKDDQRITFGSPMRRDGAGGQVLVDLPYGRSFADVIKPNVKAAICSGLDVGLNQVFLTGDKTSARRFSLYVADVDPLAVPAGRTPLLDGKPRDIWQPAPFGLDERGARVAVVLLFISILVGAQPRKGKTFSGRLLALYAALDPYVRLTIADAKNSPDWKPFRAVAHRMVMGTAPNPFSADPVDELLVALREIKAHIQEVNAFLSKLPASECPEGKLTRDLARRYPQLRVWLLVMEEFQAYFETEDQESNKEIAGLLSFIQAVGPSAGVILLSLSQKPSGVGAGDVGRLFNRFRDNHAVRFALKCGNRIVSDAILGGDAYSEGYDASTLPIGDEYRGVGLLYGYSDVTPTVRTYLATAEDAQKILAAARRHREQAGTLTGLAAGEDMTREQRDVLRDVDDVYFAGEAWISWPQLAARLAERWPEHYADATAEAISAQVRALGAAPKKGRDKFADGSPSVWGVPREHVAKARQRQEIEARR